MCRPLRLGTRVWTKHAGCVLDVEGQSVAGVETQFTCEQLCAKDAACRSVNYAQRSPTKTCRLMTVTRAQAAPDKWSCDSDDVDYYDFTVVDGERRPMSD